MASTKHIITQYYEELWNNWREELIDDLVSPELVFRGSLGNEVTGHDGFRNYMRTVRTAFPDYHNSIEEMIVEWDRAAVRLTYSGTHRGPLFRVSATGKTVEYSGVAIFQLRENLIVSCWVLGDTALLWRQIGQTPPPVVT